MKNYKTFILLFFLICTITLKAQRLATTDEGERVSLNPDGTWNLITDTTKESISYTYLNGVKYQSGIPVYISNNISVSIIKKPGQTMIMFWEDTDEQINFFKWLWNGPATIYLSNGTSINLTDRKMYGKHIDNGNYKRYACYYLTSEECNKLKSFNISRISYFVEELEGRNNHLIDILQNTSTLKNQLKALDL